MDTLFLSWIRDQWGRTQGYRLPILLLGLSVFSLIAAAVVQYIPRSEPSVQFVLGEASSSAQTRRTIIIDVVGAVEKPGVYTLSDGARIQDAIEAAGGLSRKVSIALMEKSVNRAQRVSDGAKIYIPSITDEKTESGREQLAAPLTSHNNLTGEKSVGTVNINTASQKALEALPGIGPTIASRIIDGRPYMTLEELVSKKIVGNKVFDTIKGQLTL